MFLFLRRIRLKGALVALVSLVFMQLAVAAYVCPGKGANVSEIAVMAEAGMPCADSVSVVIDGVQPNLCQAHCKAEQQSADTYQLPSLVSLSALLTVYPAPVTAPLPPGLPIQMPLVQRSTAPPLTVRNCCFRI